MFYPNVESYLQAKNYSYSPASDGNELRLKCPWCGSPDNKLYIENRSGRFICFQCEVKGGWHHLTYKLGDPDASFTPSPFNPDEEEIDPPPFDWSQVEEWYSNLMNGIGKVVLEKYLYSKRGYTEATVKKFNLGWTGKSIAIPILNARGECLNFKLKRDPTLPIPPKGMYSIRGWGQRRLFNESVLLAQHDFIIICEGEWDCMLLNQYGYPVVTSTAGASTFDKNWVQGFSKCKKIYLFYDNDRNQAGQKGALNTANIFYSYGVTVYIGKLPDPSVFQEKVDITDFFVKLEKTKEDFERLLQEATPFSPTAESKNTKNDAAIKIHIPKASEFLSTDFGETDWLVEDLIPIGGSAIIVAKRESYKTWLALYISHCITKGLPLWGKFNTTKGKVLYISNDDPTRLFSNRMEQFSFDDNLFIYHQGLPVFLVDHNNESFDAVKLLVTTKGIGVLIVDILRNTHSKDSNSDKDAKEVIERYKQLRQDNPDLVFIFLIHPSKETQLEKHFSRRQWEEAVGSYYWEASVDTVLSLTKSTDEELTDAVAIYVTKNKQSEKRFKPFLGIQRKLDGPVEFIYEEKIPEKLKIEIAKEAILALLEESPGLKREEIISRLVTTNVCGKRTAETAISELTKEGKIRHSASKPYSYYLASSPETNPQTANTYIDYGIAESNSASSSKQESLNLANEKIS